MTLEYLKHSMTMKAAKWDPPWNKSKFLLKYKNILGENCHAFLPKQDFKGKTYSVQSSFQLLFKTVLLQYPRKRKERYSTILPPNILQFIQSEHKHLLWTDVLATFLTGPNKTNGSESGYSFHFRVALLHKGTVVKHQHLLSPMSQ